jgi:recombination protein RecA
MARKTDIDKIVINLIGQLQEAHPKASVMRAREMPQRPAISCGSLAVDYASGIGGFPPDRLIEIAGLEGTGKTTLALLAMTNTMDANPGKAALIMDFEHKLDKKWLIKVLGPERESRVILTWPDFAEHGTNLYIDAVSGNEKKKIAPGQVCCALWDSIAAAPTLRRNVDRETPGFGGNSIAITDFANVAAAMSHKYVCQTIVINQVREDFSGYHQHKTVGGNGLRYMCTQRWITKKGKGKFVEKINGEDAQIGFEVAVKLYKSGLSPGGRTATYRFYNVETERYGFGVDTMEEIVRLGVITGAIERRGAWYYAPVLPMDKGENKIIGRDRLEAYLREHPDAQKAVAAEVTHRLKTGSFGDRIAPNTGEEVDVPAGFTLLSQELATFPDDPKDFSEPQLDHKSLIANSFPGPISVSEEVLVDKPNIVQSMMAKLTEQTNG